MSNPTVFSSMQAKFKAKEGDLLTECPGCHRQMEHYSVIRHLRDNPQHNINNIDLQNKKRRSDSESNNNRLQESDQMKVIYEEPHYQDSDEDDDGTSSNAGDNDFNALADLCFADPPEINDANEAEPQEEGFSSLLARMQNILNVNADNGSQPGFDVNQFANDTVPSALNQEQDAPLHSLWDPFNNLLEFVLIAFFDGCSVTISEEKIRLIYFVLKIVVALVKADASLEMPTVNYLLNYSEQKKCRVPKIPITEHDVRNLKTGDVHTLYMNKPSKYLEFLMANPIKNPVLTNSMPDFTPGELSCLQQGEKWRTHPMLQNPMYTHGAYDIWVGDVVEIGTTSIEGIASGSRFLVSQFYHKKDASGSLLVYAKGLEVSLVSTDSSSNVNQTNFVVSNNFTEVPIRLVSCVVDKSVSYVVNGATGIASRDSNGFIGFFPLESHVNKLWLNQIADVERLKRRRPDGSLMKVVVAPITLFTDDTSGNLSKQYNIVDSYLMTPAAYSYEDRGSKNNQYFICAGNKTLSAVDILPPLVDNLVELEDGIEMYSVSHGERVLVVAPLLFIQADNHRQSALCMHMGSGANSCCRKCKFRTVKNPNPAPRRNARAEVRAAFAARETQYIKLFSHAAPARSKDELLYISKIYDAKRLEEIKESTSCDKNGSQELLRLRSFDPVLDTPVEILHSLTLGITKFLVTFLWAQVVKKKEDQAKLQESLQQYRGSKAYKRSFRSLMRHNGSFVGRNYKQLIQILPVCLRKTFSFQEDDLLGLTVKCFELVSCLSSLVYMRSIKSNVDGYLKTVGEVVAQINEACVNLDNYCIKHKVKPAFVSIAPKTHLLNHLVADIVRFGPAVHFETEHGEQYNKFIREEFVLTNRQVPTRDVAASFGKQFAIHHLLDGGSFLVKCGKAPDGSVKHARAYPSPCIASFLTSGCPEFTEKLLGARENADNNEYVDPSLNRMQEGSAGVFKSTSSSSLFFARVTRCQANTPRDRSYYVQQYDMLPYNEAMSRSLFGRFRSRMLPLFLTDQENNIVLAPRGEEFMLDSSHQYVESMDMDNMSPSGHLQRLLNVHKFGSLWTLLQCHASYSR
ncbi:hypothetical protein MBANPS3_012293 [Mucor bainieri]